MWNKVFCCATSPGVGSHRQCFPIVVEFPMPSLATIRSNLVSFTLARRSFRSLQDTHEGNPFHIFPYSGNTSSDSKEVVNFFIPETLCSMANELLTWCDIWSNFFSIMSLMHPLLYAMPSKACVQVDHCSTQQSL